MHDLNPGEHFRISVWRHRINASGCLIVSAEQASEFYISQNKSYFSQGNWELLTLEIYVPSKINTILVYAWNEKNPFPVYFDDLTIEFLPKKPQTEKITNIYTDSRDNRRYKTMKLANDWWMMENLNFNLDSNCTCYDNNELNCIEYGRLYNFASAIAACPPGWELPSDIEWKNLERNIGMQESEVNKEGFRGNFESIKLREFGETGFDSKMGGARDINYYFLNQSAVYWSSTKINDSMAYCREFSQSA